MTAVWIILAALLAVVLLGTVLFLIACRRGPVPDLTKPEVIAKWGRAEQTEEILAGVRLMQEAENIFCRLTTACACTGGSCSSRARRGRSFCFTVTGRVG